VVLAVWLPLLAKEAEKWDTFVPVCAEEIKILLTARRF